MKNEKWKMENESFVTGKIPAPQWRTTEGTIPPWQSTLM